MADKHIKRTPRNNLDGNTVHVGDQPFEVAFRKFRKKIETGGLLRELRDREHYVKPTTNRKQKKAAAIKRWEREVAKTKLPPKMY
jgi:small subunit ribosomal protein S21